MKFKRKWYIFCFVALGLLYFAIKYLIKSNGDPDTKLLKKLHKKATKNIEKMHKIDEKLIKLEGQKVNKDDIKTNKRIDLVNSIKSRLHKSANK